MSRYVTQAWWAEDEDFFTEAPLSMTIVEEESSSVDTGLLDASGRKLYRVETREPMGFKLNGRRNHPA